MAVMLKNFLRYGIFFPSVLLITCQWLLWYIQRNKITATNNPSTIHTNGYVCHIICKEIPGSSAKFIAPASSGVWL